MGECHNQALDACQQYMAQHDQAFVYVLTTLGTQAKSWRYERGDQFLVTTDQQADHDDPTSAYIEMNSLEGARLMSAFDQVKSFPPRFVAGNKAPFSEPASR